MGWTVATLPIPGDWITARRPLAELAERRHQGQSISAGEYSTLVADAYGIPMRHLEPLLRWNAP